MPLDQVDVDKLPLNGVEKEMTFLEHLEELRWHIVRSVVAIAVVGIAVFLSKDLVTAMIFAPTKPEFITYDIICKVVTSIYANGECMSPPTIQFITPKFGEKFITFLKISIVLGVIVSFPYLFLGILAIHQTRFIRCGAQSCTRRCFRLLFLVYEWCLIWLFCHCTIRRHFSCRF